MVKELDPARAGVPDWRKAEEHLARCEREYDALRGVPGVNPYFAIVFVLKPLRARLNGGERSQELFDEIMEVQ